MTGASYAATSAWFGWVWTLPIELAAVQKVFDEKHEELDFDPADNDEDLNVLGSIGGHHVAIMSLPSGHISDDPAAAVATRMLATSNAIRFGLMAGGSRNSQTLQFTG